MKRFTYILACAGLVWGHSLIGHAEQSCEDRATELNDRFAAEYIKLEGECYPADKDPISSSDGSFDLSPECQAKYNALSTKAAEEWDTLYQACPDLPRPIPVDANPTGDPRDSRQNILGPNMRAPTKQELFDRVNTLKGKLKRAKSRQRKLARQCGK